MAIPIFPLVFSNMYFMSSSIRIYCFLAIPILLLYNGEKGKASRMKWFFYLYYPLHLILIGVARLALYGDVPLLF
jgi:hypothetical protein